MAKSSEVAKAPPSGGALAARAQGGTGPRGVSESQSDNLVPIIYVLQSNSPQVIPRNPDRIEGAEAGMIWLRNMPDPLVRGEDGISFQPCYFHRDIGEWRPRDAGGGFLGRHEFLPGEEFDAAVRRLGGGMVTDQKTGRVRAMTRDGNELVDTRHHVGYIHGHSDLGPIPVVLSMSSTGHTTSRQWMFMMNQKRLRSFAQALGYDPKTFPDEKADSFAYRYRLKTRVRSNATGEWFAWDVSDEGPVDEQTYEMGKSLFDAFAAGEKTMEAPTTTATESDPPF